MQPLRRQAERLLVRGLGAARRPGLRPRADPPPARARGARRWSTTAPTSRTTRSRRSRGATTRRPCSAASWPPPPPGSPYVFGVERRRPGHAARLHEAGDGALVAQRLELLLDAGADGFMQDFGEQVQDGHAASPTAAPARTMHNRYPVIWHRAQPPASRTRWARRNPERGTPWFFTRSGYSGRPGSAAYEMGNFPGDETVDWSAGSGPALARPGHAQPRRGRRVRLHDGHRRLRRPADRAAERRAVHALDRVVGADPVLPGAQLVARTARGCPGPTGPRCWRAGRRWPLSTTAPPR